MDKNNNVLAKVIRGDILESFHQGHIVVVDKRGEIRYSVGDPQFFTYIRSAAKPLQALAVIESGAADHYSLSKAEIALMCASHSGEEIHVATGQSILRKLVLPDSILLCGTHLPNHKPSANKLMAAGQAPLTLHNNCSGKHLGMLTLARYRKNSLADYVNPNHPVQQEMLQVVARYCQLAPATFKLGTDGCGVPVFAMPLTKMAYAYAQLVMESKKVEPPKRVVESMVEFPHLVAGTGQLCTDLMSATNRKLIAKFGAEGIYCVGLLEEELGIAIKINDGNQRALGPVVIETLNQLGILTSLEREQLANWHFRKLTNHRQEVIGQIIPSFKLRPH